MLGCYEQCADSAGSPLHPFRELCAQGQAGKLQGHMAKVWRVPFGQPDRSHAAADFETPAGLDMGNPVTRDAVFMALANAVGIVRTAGFAPELVLSRSTSIPQSRLQVHGQRRARRCSHASTPADGRSIASSSRRLRVERSAALAGIVEGLRRRTQQTDFRRQTGHGLSLQGVHEQLPGLVPVSPDGAFGQIEGIGNLQLESPK